MVSWRPYTSEQNESLYVKEHEKRCPRIVSKVVSIFVCGHLCLGKMCTRNVLLIRRILPKMVAKSQIRSPAKNNCVKKICLSAISSMYCIRSSKLPFYQSNCVCSGDLISVLIGGRDKTGELMRLVATLEVIIELRSPSLTRPKLGCEFGRPLGS